jgi:hypothetical protein
MVWTYSQNPALSAKDAVRFHSGDTDSADPLVSDEEIAFALGEESTAVLAAAAICEALAARFARQVDKSVGDLRLSLNQKAQAFAAKAEALRERAATAVEPYAGGLSQSEREASRADSDLIQPAFRVDLFCTPGAADGE